MPKSSKKIPIMTLDSERLMAFEGLVQWTDCVVEQAKRVSASIQAIPFAFHGPFEKTRLASLKIHSECHFFCVAANKLIEHREWVAEFGLCQSVDFSQIDSFSKKDIKDLRNMREHQIEYFKGEGNNKNSWFVRTPEFSADASSLSGNQIGGRLDYVKFAAAAKSLLPALLSEPIPISKITSTVVENCNS